MSTSRSGERSWRRFGSGLPGRALAALAVAGLFAVSAGCSGGEGSGAMRLRIGDFDDVRVSPSARHMKLGPTAAAILAEQAAATEGIALVLPSDSIEKTRTSWELLSESPEAQIQVEAGEGDVELAGEMRTEGGDLVASLRVSAGLPAASVEARGPLGSGERNKVLFRELALRMLAALRPGDPKLLVRLGIALREQGLIREAVEAYARAITLQPDFAAAHYNMGVAYDAGGDVKNAAAAYARAIEADPLHARARYNWALDELREREPAETVEAFRARAAHAEELLRRALEPAPRMKEAWGLLVEAVRMQGRSGEAVDEALRMQRIFPDDGQAREILGCLYLSMDRHADAIEQFRRAQEMQPGLLSTVYFLGLALEAAGRTEEAVAQYEAFLTAAGGDQRFERARKDASSRVEALRGKAESGGGQGEGR